MSKRRNPKRKAKPALTRGGRKSAATNVNAPARKESKRPRNSSLDTLRGLAIVLMVIDHAAGILFDESIRDSPVRFVTRLSMPLFCVLMGYFLDPKRRFFNGRLRWRRISQILVAAVLVNAVFWPYYGRIEILGSLLLAYGLIIVSGRFFAAFVFAIMFYADDPLVPWLDYPITIVLSFVAQGMVLRKFGIRIALLTGAMLSLGSLGIYLLEPQGVNHMLCYFILPATLLVHAGQRRPNHPLAGLQWIGRYPLTTYVIQYYIVFAVAYGWMK